MSSASPLGKPANGLHAAQAPGVATARSVHDLPADARELMERCAADQLAFCPGWMANLESTVFPGHAGLRYLVLRGASSEVQAVLPLVLERRGWAWHARALGNWYTALYEPALAPGTSAAALVPLLQAVRREARGALGSITLAPMDPQGQAYATLETALRMAGFAAFRYFCFGNWHMPAPESWTRYLATRHGKLRNTIKRMGQKLAADGGRLEIITSAEDLPRGLAAYEAVYAKSWKQAEPSPGFVPGLMQLCTQRRALRLGVAWLGDKAIAAQFWFLSGRRAEIYKLAYDEDYKAYSPGTLLTAHLMQHVLEADGVAEVDYLIGDDDYKRRWLEQRRERWGIIAYNLHSAPGLAGSLGERVRRLAKAALQAWRARRGAHPAASADTTHATEG